MQNKIGQDINKSTETFIHKYTGAILQNRVYIV